MTDSYAILAFQYINITRHCMVINTHDFHSGGPDFNSGHEERLSWIKFPVVKPSPSRQVPIQLKKIKSCPCALTEHHAMKAYWGSGDTAPCILDLGATCRWVINFTTWPLYPQGKEPQVPTHWIGGWVGPRASLISK